MRALPPGRTAENRAGRMISAPAGLDLRFGRRLGIYLVLGSLSFCTAIGRGGTGDIPAPLSFVHILQGTDSKREFSHGNTLPLVSAPWSMTDWCIQNREGMNERWFFQSASTTFYGFRATHSPCPWAGDYGHFMISPQTGPRCDSASDWAAGYDPNQTVMRPDYLRIRLAKYHLTAELTASERCSVIRLQFDPAPAAPRTGRLLFDFPGEAQLQAQDNRLWGYSKYHGGSAEGDFHCYFVGELDRPITAVVPVGTDQTAGNGHGLVEFDIRNPKVEIKFATSYISYDQAWRNLKREAQGGFDAVRMRTSNAWQSRLSKIAVTGSEDQLKTFYSCLYRALKFPHKIYELDATGASIHYSPWDGKVHRGVAYADSGLWDTYRTLFPFLSILYPNELGEMISGWLNAYREGGWLPQWPNPGGFRGMPGSHADAMIADAMSKGIPGFDYGLAYRALRQDAFETSSGGNSAGKREAMEDYLRLGYVPAHAAPYWVSETLDYAYDDWCVAQAAKLMGHAEDYRILMRRSQNYRKLWDPAVQFMRGKDAEGRWADSPFDPFAWGDGYAESGPWQTSWSVQHDIAGLADLTGGREAFKAILEKLFHQPSTFHVGGYGSEIHEMTEFAAANMGQFMPNNQPGFHLPFLFAAVGEPWETEYWTRRACSQLFNAGPDGFCGDDDNGSLSAWYLFSSIGLYALSPGQPTYILTSPLVDSATLYLENGRSFQIRTSGNSPDNVYVQSRTLHGVELTTTWISHSQITEGGTLECRMGATPHKRTITEEELPYSAKTEMQTR